MENKIYSNKDKDLVLVRRLKRGDYKAFDLLLLKYQSRVVGLALKFVKDLQIDEDIAQDEVNWFIVPSGNTDIEPVTCTEPEIDTTDPDILLNRNKKLSSTCV